MRRQFIGIGSAPFGEDCVQGGDPGYETLALAECRRFIRLLRKVHGPEQGSAHLAVERFHHDFGDYLEVVCWYIPGDPYGEDYAAMVDRGIPETWGEEIEPSSDRLHPQGL